MHHKMGTGASFNTSMGINQQVGSRKKKKREEREEEEGRHLWCNKSDSRYTSRTRAVASACWVESV